MFLIQLFCKRTLLFVPLIHPQKTTAMKVVRVSDMAETQTKRLPLWEMVPRSCFVPLVTQNGKNKVVMCA